MAKKRIGISVPGYDWETEEDLRALCRAEGVRKDPERMKRAKTLAKQKLDESKVQLSQAQSLVDMGEGKEP